MAKAAEVLNVLAADGELTAGELAVRTGEPRSSIYRLLTTMLELELVDVGSRRGAYRLGIGLLRLGGVVSQRLDEAQYAVPTMERIHQETGETVFLCLRRKMEAVCVVRLEGRRVQSLALRLGGSLPLHLGAAPRALLAQESREFWMAYLQQPGLQPLTAGATLTATELVPLLEQIRVDGLAVSDGDVTPGIAALGVPVFDYRGQCRAALSISGVRPAILGDDAESVRGLLIAGGQEISATMGYRRTGT